MRPIKADSEPRGLGIVAILFTLTLVTWALQSAGKLDRLTSSGFAPSPPHGEDAPPTATLELGSITTDVHDRKGAVYNLDLGVTAELSEQLSYDERSLLVAVGRQAVLDAIRQLQRGGLDPDHFRKAREAISTRVTHDLGAERVTRILFTNITFYRSERLGMVETPRSTALAAWPRDRQLDADGRLR